MIGTANNDAWSLQALWHEFLVAKVRQKCRCLRPLGVFVFVHRMFNIWSLEGLNHDLIYQASIHCR